jgi:hypothetical protein
MDERLMVLEALGDLVPFPQFGELGAGFVQRSREFAGAAGVGALCPATWNR